MPEGVSRRELLKKVGLGGTVPGFSPQPSDRPSDGEHLPT